MSSYQLGIVLDAIGIIYFLSIMLFDVAKASRGVALLLALLVVALGGLSLAGMIPADPNVFPPTPILIMNGIAFVLILSLFVPSARRFWNAIPTHRIVLWHIMRLPAGLAFVALVHAGRLPSEFGLSAGWGDAIAGALSITVALLPALRTKSGIAVWNVVGFLDFIPALGTAAMTLTASPFRVFGHGDLMRNVGDFPAELIPAYVAPILLFTHILIFQRRFAEGGRSAFLDQLQPQA